MALSNPKLLPTLSACILAIGCDIIMVSNANAVELSANFRLYGEVDRFSFLGFGDLGINFGVNASPATIGSFSFSPGLSPGVSTGVLSSVALPAFGFSVVDTTFSVPFDLDLDSPGSFYIGLGDNGINGFSGGSKQVIFDFSDFIYFGNGILLASPNQGLSLESVTLRDGTLLEDVGLSFKFIEANTLLRAGVSASDTAGIGGIVTSVTASDSPPNSALISSIKAVASSKLKGGDDGFSGQNKSLLSLDINPEPDPFVFDLAFATVSGSSNVLLTRTGPPSPSHVPGPLPILGVGAGFGFSRKLRKRIKTTRAAKAINTTC